MAIKKQHIILFLLTAVIISVFLLWPSDESRIKKLFKEGSVAVEEEGLDEAMSKVSYNYQDEHGITYLQLKEILKRQFAAFSGIDVQYENLKVDVSEKTAVAEMDIRVIATIGNETGYIIGDVKTPLHLKFRLEKERAKWLITKTEGFRF